MSADNINLTKEEEESIIENNKYLNYKEFDMAEIFAFGNIPEFENDADAFICADQAGKFIMSNGLGNHDNVVKFIESLKVHHMIVFFKQLSLPITNTMFKNSKYKNVCKELMKVSV